VYLATDTRRNLNVRELLSVHRKHKLLHQLRRNSSGVFDPAHDSIQVMTLPVSKGLAFPVVALVGAGRPPRAKTSARKRGCSMWGLRGRRSGW
jgi:ATP-dependent exoDNAse (exonuclease V) beta subunit